MTESLSRAVARSAGTGRGSLAAEQVAFHAPELFIGSADLVFPAAEFVLLVADVDLLHKELEFPHAKLVFPGVNVELLDKEFEFPHEERAFPDDEWPFLDAEWAFFAMKLMFLHAELEFRGAEPVFRGQVWSRVITGEALGQSESSRSANEGRTFCERSPQRRRPAAARPLIYNDGPMSAVNISIVVLFSFVGLAAFRYGKRNGEARPIVLGVLLMVYGYFVSNAWLSLAVGGVLTALIFYPQSVP